MIASTKDCLVAPSILILAAILLAGCATEEGPDRQDDCAKARARYSEIRRSVKGLYAAGTTSSFQIAIAEGRLRKAKADYVSACGGRPN